MFITNDFCQTRGSLKKLSHLKENLEKLSVRDLKFKRMLYILKNAFYEMGNPLNVGNSLE